MRYFVGDTLRILDTENVRGYNYGNQRVSTPLTPNYEYVLQDCDFLEDGGFNLLINNNYWETNFIDNDFELVKRRSFRVGDTVIIAKNSRYYKGESGEEDSSNPSSNISGVIYDMSGFINVKWSNNRINEYDKEDLELIDEESIIINYENLTVFRDKLEELVKLVYPNYDIVIDGIYTTLTIKLDDFIISNSNNLSHTIRGMYLTLHFDKELLSCVRGCRDTYTYKEVVSNYGHSHLCGGVNISPNDFCFGSTPIAVLINDLNDDWSEDNFLMLLYMLDEYVKWESLEGGPYRKIESIGVVEGEGRSRIPSVSEQDINKSYNNFIDKYSSISCTINKEGYTNKLVVDEDNEDFKEMMIDVSEVKCKFNNTTKTYIYNTSSTSNLSVEELANSYNNNEDRLVYKGQQIVITIIDNKEEIEDNLKIVAHPNIVKGVADKLSRELTNYMINEYC